MRLVLFLLCVPTIALAQVPATQPAAPQVFTLDQAIQYAVDHYPSVRAALEQVNGSLASVDAAHAAVLPRLDALWQSNRATANNIFGQVLPQSVLPSLTGPVLPSASGDSVWGSATGALLSWEPFDFGLRSATVAGADAAVAQAKASEALTRLEVARIVGAAFLDVVATERAVAAAQADLDRRELWARVVHALVDNELRPGADASRVDAERAAATTRVIRSQEAVALARAALARALGLSNAAVRVDAADLLMRVPTATPAVDAAAGHPLAKVRQAAVGSAEAQEQVLARTDLPRFFVQSSVFARGSGANPDGTLDGSASGLGLQRVNWAAGVQVVFPNLFDFTSLHAREAAAAASTRSAAALYDEALVTIASEQQAAAAVVEAARAIATATPQQLAAAQQGETQARARYQAGLASIVEIADAQSLLAAAEFEDQLARVDIWRALLAEAAANGNLSPFVSLLHQ
jgi:outer membrane protein TolC